MVSLDLETYTYTVLYTFDMGFAARRIARRDATNYYILGTGGMWGIYHLDLQARTLTGRVSGRATSTSTYRFEDPFADPVDTRRSSLKGEFKCIGDILYFRAFTTINGIPATRVDQLDISGNVTELVNSQLESTRIRNATFDVNAAGDIVLVTTRADPDDTTQDILKIRRRRADGTLENLFDGGLRRATPAYANESLIHGNYLYLILCEDSITSIYRYDLTTGTGTSITRLKIVEWRTALDGAAYLFEHDGNVHFMYNIPFYTTPEDNVHFPADALGSVNRIESDGSVTRLFNIWNDRQNAWTYSMVTPLSIGEDIHFIMGYGNVGQSGDLFADNSDISNPENFLHLVRTQQLQHVITNASFSGSPYDALSELARLVNATLSFEQNIIHIRDRNALRAKTDGNTGI